MANGGGGHVLDRAWRYGRAASIRLRPRVISRSLLTVRTGLLGCLAWGTVHAQTIRPDDLTVLMAADAVHEGSVKTINMGPGKVGWVESWDSSGSLSWTGRTPVPGSYTLFAILQGSGSGCLVEVAINSRRLTASCMNTNWERVKLGTIELSPSIQTLTLRSVGSSPVAKVFSLEIVKPASETCRSGRPGRSAH
jgi:hypothetical protein